MRIYAMTEKGNHCENEDRIVINDTILSDGACSAECDGRLIVGIADGVGGNNAGAVASTFVCESLKGAVLFGKNDLLEINTRLLKKSDENDKQRRMATTLSGFCLNDGKVTDFHIGNTRIYVFQGNYIRQVTRDHTYVNRLVKMGMLSNKEAETHNRRNEITACFGGGNPEFIEALVFEENNTMLLETSRIVLTSDGVHEYVSADKLEEALNSKSISIFDAFREILDTATANGSEDDKSIVVVEK